MLFDFLFFVLSLSLKTGRSYWTAHVALFTFRSDLNWKQIFIHILIVFEQYVRYVENFPSLPDLVDN